MPNWTMFSPPYGDGTTQSSNALIAKSFSPPYGDGTDKPLDEFCAILFSPPYGDGTGTLDFWHYADKFSPPCGDRTLNISQNTAKLKSRMARKYSLYYNDVLLR